MSKTTKKTTPKKRNSARDDTRSKKASLRKPSDPDDGRCIVGSEIGVTIPIGDTTAHLRFSFWHERIAKNGTQAELKRVTNALEEFNEAELERQITKARRTIQRVLNGDDDEPEEGATHERKVSVRDRARRKVSGK
jgi:hypothetical protein